MPGCYYLLAGAATLVAEEETLYLRTGDFVCLPRGGGHRWLTSQPGQPRMLNLNRQALQGDEPLRLVCGDPALRCEGELLCMTFRLGLDPVRSRATSLPPLILLHPGKGAFRSFLPPPEILEGCTGPGARAFAADVMRVLYGQAVRTATAGMRHGRQMNMTDLRYPRVGSALQLIDGRMNMPWTVASLAAAVGMSRSAFAEAFVELVGEPPLRYLVRRRMAEAHRLITTQRRALRDVAAAVGYGSLTSFGRAFRAHLGVPPSRLR
jgi:AraC-like DNA-binding protein